MRDLVLREGLRAMARDAAKRLRELVAAGEEIPYEVREAEPGSPFSQYQPLTERFVREQAPALRELDSFGSACAALEAAGVAGVYLDEMGVAVPAEPRRRGELAAIVFLCRLWLQSTDFSLDRERLDLAIAELEAGGEATIGEIDVVVPVRGLQLPVERLELATATLVRADTVEVPPDARAVEGSGGAAWEPSFLAITRVAEGDEEPSGEAADAGARAVEDLRMLVTTLRLFRPGGVALGPHAWTRAGGDRWRRISTGAGRPRPGGYRLAEAELGELSGFSRTLASRSNLFGRAAMGRSGFSGALARAVSRFEAGLERSVVLEALNDYLLALRFLLEGGGPARLDLSTRVAGLCAEPERRDEVRSAITRAEALERELWSGEPVAIGNGPTPAQTAAAVEDLTRAILRDSACGHLGTDLRVAADEILLADGLAAGEGAQEQRGATAEWDVPLAEDAGDYALAENAEEVDDASPSTNELWLDAPLEWEPAPADPAAPADDGTDPGKVPAGGPRIRVEQQRFQAPEEDHVTVSKASNPEPEHPAASITAVADHQSPTERREQRSRGSASDRVAYLFPAPEETDWDVREISYDRSRRAPVRAS